MTGAVAAVQARIAQIQQSVVPVATPVLGSVGAVGGTTSGASAAGASSASDATFAAALAELTGTGSAVGASDAGTVVAGAGGAGAATGEDLVAAARQYLGVPYVWGGESLDEGGLDCSGLVLRSLADLGVTGVPRVARDQATLGTEVPSLGQALPGDLVVLSGGSHIGIYVGDGKMIDAPKPGASVTVRDVYAEPTTIRRVLPQSGATTTTTTTALTGALASSSAGRTALALLAGSGSTSSLTSSLWGAAS
ncbi:C40 family peptidase [Cellulomonas sp. P4]|uniref:C40 family peptidase n=1 Tax=Cellulomonas sp. P4 TaxID=3142533 RepID=UPI0031B9EE6C